MSQALHSLLEHAEAQRDEAIAALVQAEESNRRLRQQWDQLHSYHADYAALAPTLGGQATSIDRLRGHHAFMQRMEQALAQQQGLLAASDAQVTQRRQLLLEREIRVASVRKLQERRLFEEQRSTLRREQTRSDEAATQRSWRESARARSATH